MLIFWQKVSYLLPLEAKSWWWLVFNSNTLPFLNLIIPLNLSMIYIFKQVPSSLSVEAYERRIQRLEREKSELARKLQGEPLFWQFPFIHKHFWMERHCKVWSLSWESKLHLSVWSSVKIRPSFFLVTCTSILISNKLFFRIH